MNGSVFQGDQRTAPVERAGGSVHWIEPEPGVRVRAAHWGAGDRGTVLLLNGRTEYIEKYLETVAGLQGRGFAVWTLDWRGQGLSTRPLADPLLNHVESFEEYLTDLDRLLDEHVLPSLRGRLVLLAHSMGGNLGARVLARRPGLIERAVLTAPMMGFRSAIPQAVAHGLIRLVNLRAGLRERHGPGTPLRPPLDRAFDTNPLTTCPARYAAFVAELRSRPELQVGGATWGWLRAASDSIEVLSRAETVARIGVPVLIATAGVERFVDNRATARFAARLAHGETVHFAEGRHELLREQDRFRLPLWEALDGFFGPG